jgi:aromatic-L-amino-acid decarboxylase
VPLQTVCVRHVPADLDAEALDRHQQEWAERLNATGRAFVTPALVEGRWLVRLSIGAEPTERADVEALWALCREVAEESAPLG